MDKKYLLFEYLVFRLDEWKKQLNNTNKILLSKLRLQKILFLVCACDATNENKRLLDVFDNFHALPYGPVEMDIYEAMKEDGSFQNIHFTGNNCEYNIFNESIFSELSYEERRWVDDAIKKFKSENKKYLTMPVFDLVEITHKWTVWSISMDIAELLGKKQMKMSAEEICDSLNKAF